MYKAQCSLWCAVGNISAGKERSHIFLSLNKREIGPKVSGMNQGFQQLPVVVWQSQADSPNTVCLQLCHFPYSTPWLVFVFLLLQKEESHCLGKKI